MAQRETRLAQAAWEESENITHRKTNTTTGILGFWRIQRIAVPKENITKKKKI